MRNRVQNDGRGCCGNGECGIYKHRSSSLFRGIMRPGCVWASLFLHPLWRVLWKDPTAKTREHFHGSVAECSSHETHPFPDELASITICDATLVSFSSYCRRSLKTRKTEQGCFLWNPDSLLLIDQKWRRGIWSGQIEQQMSPFQSSSASIITSTTKFNSIHLPLDCLQSLNKALPVADNIRL